VLNYDDIVVFGEQVTTVDEITLESVVFSHVTKYRRQTVSWWKRWKLPVLRFHSLRGAECDRRKMLTTFTALERHCRRREFHRLFLLPVI